MSRFIDDIAWDWGIRCFGHLHMSSPHARGMRFFEEAAELALECDVTGEEMAAIITMVVNRRRSNQFREAGQVALTFATLCRAIGVDQEVAYETEVRRVLGELKEAFAQRNVEKTMLIEKHVGQERDRREEAPDMESKE